MTSAEFWNAVFELLPYLITAGVSIYAIRHTGKMKELELKDLERGRVFQIQKKITDKSIDSLWKAHYLIWQQIPVAAAIISGDENIDDKTLGDIRESHEFIKSHTAYFPLEVREKIIDASYQLNKISFDSSIDQKSKLEIIKDVFPIIKEIKKILEDYIDKFNILNY